jgi:hypothetical protein
MSRLKSLLLKKRDDPNEKVDTKAKSFMDIQNEKLAANPAYVAKQRKIALTKLAAAGFMASAKKTDFTKQVSGLLSDIKNCSFQPKLSQGTLDLLNKGGSMPGFAERLKQCVAQRKDSAKPKSLNKDIFSFAPQLNHTEEREEKSKEALRKEFEDRRQEGNKRINTPMRRILVAAV